MTDITLPERLRALLEPGSGETTEGFSALLTDLASGLLGLPLLFQTLAPYMTSTSGGERQRALTLLARLLQGEPAPALSPAGGDVILRFLGARLDPEEEGVEVEDEEVLGMGRLIHAILDRPDSCSPAGLDLVYSTLLPHILERLEEEGGGPPPSDARYGLRRRSLRTSVYAIVEATLAYHATSYILPHGAVFVPSFLAAVEGERDPRGLLRLFRLAATLLPLLLGDGTPSSGAQGVGEEERQDVFDLLFRYFPITYAGRDVPGAEGLEMHDVREALATALAALAPTPLVAHLLPALVDKSAASASSCRADVWTVLALCPEGTCTLREVSGFWPTFLGDLTWLLEGWVKREESPSSPPPILLLLGSFLRIATAGGGGEGERLVREVEQVSLRPDTASALLPHIVRTVVQAIPPAMVQDIWLPPLVAAYASDDIDPRIPLTLLSLTLLHAPTPPALHPSNPLADPLTDWAVLLADALEIEVAGESASVVDAIVGGLGRLLSLCSSPHALSALASALSSPFPEARAAAERELASLLRLDHPTSPSSDSITQRLAPLLPSPPPLTILAASPLLLSRHLTSSLAHDRDGEVIQAWIPLLEHLAIHALPPPSQRRFGKGPPPPSDPIAAGLGESLLHAALLSLLQSKQHASASLGPLLARLIAAISLLGPPLPATLEALHAWISSTVLAAETDLSQGQSQSQSQSILLLEALVVGAPPSLLPYPEILGRLAALPRGEDLWDGWVLAALLNKSPKVLDASTVLAFSSPALIRRSGLLLRALPPPPSATPLRPLLALLQDGPEAAIRVAALDSTLHHLLAPPASPDLLFPGDSSLRRPLHHQRLRTLIIPSLISLHTSATPTHELSSALLSVLLSLPPPQDPYASTRPPVVPVVSWPEILPHVLPLLDLSTPEDLTHATLLLLRHGPLGETPVDPIHTLCRGPLLRALPSPSPRVRIAALSCLIHLVRRGGARLPQTVQEILLPVRLLCDDPHRPIRKRAVFLISLLGKASS